MKPKGKLQEFSLFILNIKQSFFSLATVISEFSRSKLPKVHILPKIILKCTNNFTEPSLMKTGPEDSV